MAVQWVFNHIPKTGGRSVSRTLSAWLTPVYDYTPDPSDESFKRWKAHPLDLARLPGNTVLIGHFTGDGCRLHERYPAALKNADAKLITFLRDPLELALSSFFYRRHMNESDDDDFVDVVFEMVGCYAKTFGVGHAGITLRSALDGYWFVGITEQMPESFAMLAAAMGRPVPAACWENRTERDPALTLDASTRRRFYRAAEADYAIYEAAKTRFSSELARCGRTG